MPLLLLANIIRSNGLFSSKGKGKATYYIPGKGLSTEVASALNTEPSLLGTEPITFNGEPITFENEPVTFSTEADVLSTEEGDALSTEANAIDRETLLNELSLELKTRISELKGRESNLQKMQEVIKDICEIRPYKLVEIASLLQKGDNYLSRKYLKPMIDSSELHFLHQEMTNHPEQAYWTTKKTNLK